MQQWEYHWITVFGETDPKRGLGKMGQEVRSGATEKVISNDVTGYLASLGDQGWELVSSSGAGGSLWINLFFNRPK